MDQATHEKLKACCSALQGVPGKSHAVTKLVSLTLQEIVDNTTPTLALRTDGGEWRAANGADPWARAQAAVADAYSTLRTVHEQATAKGGYVPAATLKAVERALARLNESVTTKGTPRQRRPPTTDPE